MNSQAFTNIVYWQNEYCQAYTNWLKKEYTQAYQNVMQVQI